MNLDFYSSLIENKVRNIGIQSNNQTAQSQDQYTKENDAPLKSNLSNVINMFTFKKENDNQTNDELQITPDLRNGIQEATQKLRHASIKQTPTESLIQLKTEPSIDRKQSTSLKNHGENKKSKTPTKKIKTYKIYFKNQEDIHHTIEETFQNDRHFRSSNFQHSYLIDNNPSPDQTLFDFLRQITPESSRHHHLIKRYMDKAEGVLQKKESQTPKVISAESNQMQTIQSLNSMLAQSIIKDHSRNQSDLHQPEHKHHLNKQSTITSVSSLKNIDAHIRDGESPSCKIKTNPPSYISLDKNNFIDFCHNWNQWKQSLCNAIFFYYTMKTQIILYDTMQNFVHFHSCFEWFKSIPESTLGVFFPFNHFDHSFDKKMLKSATQEITSVSNQNTSVHLPYFNPKMGEDRSFVDPLFKCQKSSTFIYSIVHQTSIKQTLEAVLFWVGDSKQKIDRLIEMFRPKFETAKSKNHSLFNDSYFAQAIKYLDRNKKERKRLASCKIKNCFQVHLQKEQINWGNSNPMENHAHPSMLKKMNLRHEYHDRLQKINTLVKTFKQNINQDTELMFMWIQQNQTQTHKFSEIMKQAIYFERDNFVQRAFEIQHDHSRNIAILAEDVDTILKHIEPKIVLIKSEITSNNCLESEIYSDLQMRINQMSNEIESVFENTMKQPYLFNFNKYCDSNKDIIEQLISICSPHMENQNHLENFLKFYMIKQFLQAHQEVLSQINYHIRILNESCSMHQNKLKSKKSSLKVFDTCRQIQKITSQWIAKHDKIVENNRQQCKDTYEMFEKRLKNISETKMKKFMTYISYPINPQNQSVSKIIDYHELFCKEMKESIDVSDDSDQKFSKLEECVMTCCSIYNDQLEVLRYECLIHVLFDSTNRNEKTINKKS